MYDNWLWIPPTLLVVKKDPSSAPSGGRRFVSTGAQAFQEVALRRGHRGHDVLHESLGPLVVCVLIAKDIHMIYIYGETMKQKGVKLNLAKNLSGLQRMVHHVSQYGALKIQNMKGKYTTGVLNT